MNRCAVYTRKSTEEGLEQDFNSLHAQREACEAYIKSQQHEGWRLVRKHYDDGGVSGGTMNRPALQELLAAVERREVDIIVVYKVDRLTRSLADFAKIVELLDHNGGSFVSVTQQFNTTNSMGRLTLNVLLSFAQFEREVTAERIRDKIAASKKKGLWMGGPPPLGYDVRDKKLVINRTEAQTVRQLFDLYVELGTVRRLKDEADRLGILTKKRKSKSGKETGGKPFTRGNLYQLLANPLYIGRVRHKEETYPGAHKAIIDQATWDAAQRILAGNAVERTSPTNARAPFLLTGKAYDETGDLMVQSQCDKKGKRYRYYISKRLMHESHKHKDGWRLAAKTLEDAVITPVRELLQDQGRLIDLLQMEDQSTTDLTRLKTRAAIVAIQLADGEPDEKKVLLQGVIERIDLAPETISITLNQTGLTEALGTTPPEDKSPIALTVPIRLQRRGVETKLIIQGPNASHAPDSKLCQLIARARLWFDQLAAGEMENVKAIAEREKLPPSEVSRILPLAFLAPKIVEMILDGKQPEGMTVKYLERLPSLPRSWQDQQTLLRATNC